MKMTHKSAKQKINLMNINTQNRIKKNYICYSARKTKWNNLIDGRSIKYDFYNIL